MLYCSHCQGATKAFASLLSWETGLGSIGLPRTTGRCHSLEVVDHAQAHSSQSRRSRPRCTAQRGPQSRCAGSAPRTGRRRSRPRCPGGWRRLRRDRAGPRSRWCPRRTAQHNILTTHEMHPAAPRIFWQSQSCTRAGHGHHMCFQTGFYAAAVGMVRYPAHANTQRESVL